VIFQNLKSINKSIFNLKDYQVNDPAGNCLDTSKSQIETLVLTKSMKSPTIEKRPGDLVESIISNDII